MPKYKVNLHFIGYLSQWVEVESLDVASALMRRIIEYHNYGASDMLGDCGEVRGRDAQKVAKIRYNGSVELVPAITTNKWPASTCSECGKLIPAGTQQQCEYGGLCSDHVPIALRNHIDNIERKVV